MLAAWARAGASKVLALTVIEIAENFTLSKC